MSTFSVSSNNFDDLATALVEVGQVASRFGWVPATSGNFSARLEDAKIAITVSGTHKGYLNTTDIMIVNSEGQSLDGRRSSAETLLHTWLYQWQTDIHAVLHTHSVAATCLSQIAGDSVVLQDLEVLKAFNGIESHDVNITIPVFKNDQDIQRLSAVVAAYLERHPDIPGYLIAGHGLYAWGDSIESAICHLEAFEFLFNCSLQLRGLKQS